MASQPILEIDNLKTHFFTNRGVVTAVDGSSWKINAGDSLGLVGESGSGKSVSALSIMQLVPKPGKIIGGKILFNGDNLLGKDLTEMRKIRGAKISMSFQDPMTYLNPAHQVGDQIAEAIMLHNDVSKSDAIEQAAKTMELVQIPVEGRVKDFPHQFSGGMRQRLLLAIALSCSPDILIADEPTTSLDVLVQAEILQLLFELKKKLNMTLILITHDLGIAAQLCNKIAIMYAGKMVEFGSSKDIFSNPRHPYTMGLLNSVPRVDTIKSRLTAIPGTIPDMVSPPSGCRFHPRCTYSVKDCEISDTPMVNIVRDRLSACIRDKEIHSKKSGGK